MSTVKDITPCDRCGCRRVTRTGRPSTGLCRDCELTDPGWPDVLAYTEQQVSA